MPETVLVNGNAYSLLKLLGKGKGGYSYLAQMADGQQVVVKQIHHEPCVYYQFGNKIEAELRDYNHLQEIGIPMPRMLDVDTKAERIVKEYIAGETVRLCGKVSMKLLKLLVIPLHTAHIARLLKLCRNLSVLYHICHLV